MIIENCLPATPDKLGLHGGRGRLKIVNLLFLSLLALLSLLTLFSSPAHAAPTTWKSTQQIKPLQYIEDIRHTGQISAVVGHGLVTIEGYTSPRAKVALTSSQNNLGRKTTQANQEGFFKFTRVILPVNPGELWLQATDIQDLTTTPLALPEPPASVSKIEGIILPPSVAQSHQAFTRKVNGYGFGHTVPRAKIVIYLSADPALQNNFINRLKKLFRSVSITVKKVFARQEVSIPINNNKHVTTTNSKGYFNFPLPKNKTGSYRYFVAARVQENYSPKSSDLTFQVQSPWQRLCQQLLAIADKLGKLCLRLLKDLLFWITIEIITLFALIRGLKRGKSSKSKVPARNASKLACMAGRQNPKKHNDSQSCHAEFSSASILISLVI